MRQSVKSDAAPSKSSWGRWIVAGFAVALSSAMACGQASAGFNPVDQDCTLAVINSKPPKFDDPNYYSGLTKAWASADGVTGVFFLQSPGSAAGQTSTVVLKFELQRNVGAVASRKIFDSLGVPSDTLITEITDAKKIAAVYNGLQDIRSRDSNNNNNNTRIVDPDNFPIFEAKLDDLSGRFNKKDKTNYGPPQQIIATRFLTGFESASSFGKVFEISSVQRVNGTLSPQAAAQKRARVVRQFLGGIKALTSQHNQKLLGYLYAIDMLVGNNDRMARTPVNWGNVFLAQGRNNAACLEAIDNEAHVPAPGYMAMARYVSEKKDFVPFKIDKKAKPQATYLLKKFPGRVVRFQTAADPADAGEEEKFLSDGLTSKWIESLALEQDKNKQPIDDAELAPDLRDVGAEFKGDKQVISGQDYLTALTWQYEDALGSVNPTFFGPQAILRGAHLDHPINGNADLHRNRSGPSVETCEQANERPMPGHLPIWVRRHLRSELIWKMDQISGAPLAAMMNGGDAGIAIEQLSQSGEPLVLSEFSDSNYICKTKVSVFKGAAAQAVGGQEMVIDWPTFDQNFEIGFEEALGDIRSFTGKKGDVLYNAVDGISDKKTDISLAGLMARRQFIIDYAGGQVALDQVIPGMLQNSAYNKGGTYDATTFVLQTNTQSVLRWVPK